MTKKNIQTTRFVTLEMEKDKKIVGQSKSMQRVRYLIKEVSQTDVDLLITGETGTGKDLVAETIHRESLRREKSMVAISCAAIPSTLLENELFGHRRGAFTSATDDQIGSFQRADGSTLYLDEIEEMSKELQAKLLRAIETKEISPLGSGSLPVDVRIIASTSIPLKEAVACGAFRADLFYRISVVNIDLPALRERKEDISLLFGHFLSLYGEKYQKSISLDSEAMALLIDYDWPGNVRELENLLKRIMILADDRKLGVSDLMTYMDFDALDVREILPLKDALEQYEKEHLLKSLSHTNSDKTEAAQLLGIDLSTLYRKMKKYGLK